MRYKRKVSKFGGSIGLTLPIDLLNYINMPKGTIVLIEDMIDDNNIPYLTVKRDPDANTETID